MLLLLVLPLPLPALMAALMRDGDIVLRRLTGEADAADDDVDDEDSCC